MKRLIANGASLLGLNPESAKEHETQHEGLGVFTKFAQAECQRACDNELELLRNRVMAKSPSIDRSKLPPGPHFAALQSFGYMRDPYGYMKRMRARYGDTFTMPTMNGLLVLANTTEGAREVLKGGEKDFGVGFGVDVLSHLLGENSLLLISGHAHQRERKILSPVFHGNRMKAYAPAMRQAALEQSASWRTGESVVMQSEMQSISLDVIIRAVLGVTEPTRISIFRDAIRHAVSEISPWPLFLAPLRHEFLGMGPWARFLRSKRIFDELLYEEIVRARSQPQSREDILSRLVESADEEGNTLTDGAIRDHLVTLLVAGHETTSSALAWAFEEIGRHPAIENWLHDELASLGPEPDPVQLANLPALHAVAKESLRLHPIIPEFFRTVKDGYRFMEWDLPPGVILAGSMLSIQKDPDLYPQPEKFDPNRFIEKSFSPHEFTAFGGAHRYCLGSAFALAEMAVIIGTLLPRFELRSGRDRPLKTVRNHVTLGPEGGAVLEVRAKRIPAAQS